MSMDLMRGMEVHRVLPLRVGGVDVSLTNASLVMLTACLLFALVLAWALRRPRLEPGRMQLLVEVYYGFVRDIVHGNISHRHAERFVPAMFTLFTLIVSSNLAGIAPGVFGATTQIVITGTLAASVFAWTIWLRLRLHGWRFFLAFAPRGVPVFILPLVVPIEMLSFLARPVTLAVRLFANMTAGHAALAVLAVLGLGAPWFLAWLPMGFTLVQIAMEMAIAVIQAYIFTVLTCVYIDDALTGH